MTKQLEDTRETTKLLQPKNVSSKPSGNLAFQQDESNRQVNIHSYSLDLPSRPQTVSTDADVKYTSLSNYQESNCSSAAEKPEPAPPTEEEQQISGGLNFRTLSTRKKLMFLFCICAQLTAGCSFSLMAPFFPQEATKKGMSLTLTGFVFSVFELVIFITSPLLGAYLTKLGPKFVFLSGVFVGGTCNILFGTLEDCPSGTPFLVLSILCRSIEALGFSGYITAMVAIITSEFPKNVATAISLLETANGIGLMVGPALGGVLYDVGGFGLPFHVIGGIVILNGIIIFVFIPHPEDIKQQNNLSKLTFFRSPMVLAGMGSIAIGSLGISLLDPTLSNHLEPFGLSVSVIGLFFVIAPAMYTVGAPLWGYLTDTKGLLGTLIVGGHFVFGVGFLFIGPSELLPFLPYEIWTIIIGLVLVGFTFGCLLFPPVKCMATGAIELGFEENLDTYAVLAGLLNSMYSLGAFTGPMAGGAVVQALGYSTAYTTMGLISIVMGFVFLLFFSKRHFSKSKLNETLPLLESMKEEDRVKLTDDKTHDFEREASREMGRQRTRTLSNPTLFSRSISIPLGPR